jgi:pyrroloquinoline quinone biosynthesis protein B
MALISVGLAGCATPRMSSAAEPYLLVLGTGQDGGVPQAGQFGHPGWTEPKHRRLVTCLALVDPRQGKRWLFEATPDFREQLYRLHKHAPVLSGGSHLDGIFLTHAHIGHYTGLIFLGHESMGAHSVPVHAMPRMARFLEANGPWDQLVRYENIALQPLEDGKPVVLGENLVVRPFLVPHRQEYSEVVGYRIDGPCGSVLFIPDIDSWSDLDAQGTRIETLIAEVDVAYVDGTFYANGEIPGRDMSGFPHPFITHSIDRFAALPSEQRQKIRFIHLNHTNPAQYPGSSAARHVRKAGMAVAEELERFSL